MDAVDDVTQKVGTALAIGGNTALSSTTGDIILGESGNNFAGSFGASGDSVALTNYAHPLVLGDIVTQTALNIVTNDQPVTQAVGSTLLLQGTSLIDAGTSTIALTNSGNSYSGITLLGSNTNAAEQAVARQATNTATYLANIITAITNTTSINVNLPKQTTGDTPMQTLNLIEGNSVSFVSTPKDGETLQAISLDEVKTMMSKEDDGTDSTNTQETRVAINENYIVELINGGVKLPDGVDQEFYIVKNEAANETNSDTSTRKKRKAN